MTKREYLAALEREMAGLDAQERAAQLAYYSEVFDDMLEDGLSEAEAAARLEAARCEAGETARAPEKSEAKEKTANGRRWKRVLIGVLVAVVLTPGIMIASKVIFGVARSGASVENAVEAVITSIKEEHDWDGAFQPSGHYTVNPVAAGVRSLDISWTRGDVKVTVWEKDHIDFSEGAQEQEYALRWCVDDGTLYIEDYGPRLDLGDSEPKNLTVRLPHSVSTSMIDFSFDGVSADLTAEGLCPEHFAANTSSGAVRADGHIEDVELDSVSGDLSFSGWATYIDANTSSGQITIETEEDMDVMKVEARSVSGAVNVSGSVGNLEAHTTSGAVALAPGASVTALRVDTVSGNVSLALPEDFRAVVRYSTVSGKVENHLPQIAVNPEGEQAQEWRSEIAMKISTTSGDLTLAGR